MSERRKIEDKLRKKEQEIQSLESQIKDARIYIQALQDVLKMLPRENNQGDSGATAATLRPGSGVAQAREVILKEGKPLHILDILKGMGKEPTREARISLGGSLAAYVRQGAIFTRPAPNTFGLIELGHNTDGTEREPPADFGVDN